MTKLPVIAESSKLLSRVESELEKHFCDSFQFGSFAMTSDNSFRMLSRLSMDFDKRFESFVSVTVKKCLPLALDATSCCSLCPRKLGRNRLFLSQVGDDEC